MAKELVSLKADDRQEANSNDGYVLEDEAHCIYGATQALGQLFSVINPADGYWELLSARRMCELVIADTIKVLNDTIESMKIKFPDLEISDYKGPIENSYLPIK